MLDKMFTRYNIKTRFGKKIKEFVEDGVIFEDESKLGADLIMFIAAGTGSSILKTSDLHLSEAGFLKINNFSQVPGFGNVFAAGDAAAYEGPDWISKQGHIAEIMGRNVADNIIAVDNGHIALKGYQEHLSILCVMDTGDGAAFVYRKGEKAFLLPMPFIGHWLKRSWGWYAKLTKVGKLPRFPGM
jgi:sulfide:quinone oxidoreductase